MSGKYCWSIGNLRVDPLRAIGRMSHAFDVVRWDGVRIVPVPKLLFGNYQLCHRLSMAFILFLSGTCLTAREIERSAHTVFICFYREWFRIELNFCCTCQIYYIFKFCASLNSQVLRYLLSFEPQSQTLYFYCFVNDSNVYATRYTDLYGKNRNTWRSLNFLPVCVAINKLFCLKEH